MKNETQGREKCLCLTANRAFCRQLCILLGTVRITDTLKRSFLTSIRSILKKWIIRNTSMFTIIRILIQAISRFIMITLTAVNLVIATKNTNLSGRKSSSHEKKAVRSVLMVLLRPFFNLVPATLQSPLQNSSAGLFRLRIVRTHFDSGIHSQL